MSRPTAIADGGREASPVTVRLEPVPDVDALGAAWRALEPRSEPSFFRSWGWIGCWLRHLPPDRQPLAAVATRDEKMVGLGVFVPVPHRRRWIMPGRSLRLHESGEPGLDSLYIEHNGLLAERAHAPDVWAAVLGRLIGDGRWGELALPGLPRQTSALCAGAAQAHGCDVAVRQQRPSAHLDLEGLRRSGRAFGDALSRNSRHQLMRARRLYAAIGPITLRTAQTADEALGMLDQLKALHQRSWGRRGQPGCFATPWFESFHRDLIGERFRHGEIQLLRAAAEHQAIGYLYNFAYGDRIYAYQSGFDYAADGRLKPGLVTHALAIEQAMRERCAVYDFMAGENRLKASFASHWSDMVWLSVRRPSVAVSLERRLAAMQRRVTGAGRLRARMLPGGNGTARHGRAT